MRDTLLRSLSLVDSSEAEQLYAIMPSSGSVAMLHVS